MNVYLPNLRLPSEYQEVEYIGRNGNNYIDTGWIPTQGFTVKIGYKIADSGYRYVMLSQYGGGNYGHAVALEINSGSVTNNSVRFYCGNTPTTTQFYSSNSLNLNSFNDITITSPGTITLNGTTTTNSSMYTGTYDNGTCRLFIDNDTSFSTFSHNSFISYCKIYEGSTLVRDFVPCYRKSDNVIGLYDLVNNQFYTNSGTGTFSKGNDVTMTELKNAYIGLGPIEYTIPTFKSADTGNFLEVAKSGYTIKSVIAEGTITYKSEYSSGYTGYIGISDNSSGTKVGRLLMRVNNNPYLAINFRINGTQNEFTLTSSWIVANGTNKYKIKYTRTGYELTVNGNSTSGTRSTSYAGWVADIFNSSTFNVYSWAIGTENSQKFTVEYQ